VYSGRRRMGTPRKDDPSQAQGQVAPRGCWGPSQANTEETECSNRPKQERLTLTGPGLSPKAPATTAGPGWGRELPSVHTQGLCWRMEVRNIRTARKWMTGPGKYLFPDTTSWEAFRSHSLLPPAMRPQAQTHPQSQLGDLEKDRTMGHWSRRTLDEDIVWSGLPPSLRYKPSRR
jgi:hypothetical protein